MIYHDVWWTMMDYVELYTRIYHGVANAPWFLPDSTGSREMPSWLQRSSLIPQPLSRQLGIAWHSCIAKFCPVEECESLWDPDPSDPVCACLRCLFAPVRSPTECSLLLKLRMHGTSHRNWQSSRPRNWTSTVQLTHDRLIMLICGHGFPASDSLFLDRTWTVVARPKSSCLWSLAKDCIILAKDPRSCTPIGNIATGSKTPSTLSGSCEPSIYFALLLPCLLSTCGDYLFADKVACQTTLSKDLVDPYPIIWYDLYVHGGW